MSEPVIIEGATLLAGDVREVLRGLEAESVHCVITSTPYWGLRTYGTEPQVWGGRAGCEHEWASETRDTSKKGNQGSTLASGPGYQATASRWTTVSASCRLCGAWRGELGQEPTPSLFVEHLVEVFREVRRVLRPDGTLWLNLGDSYAGSMKGWSPSGPGYGGPKQRTNAGSMGLSPAKNVPGLKPKDLCEIPSDVVRALRADGWWLRSRIPWLKRNPMPESTQDRPTSAVEYVFLLTKAERYYYDYEAVKAGASTAPHHSGYLDGADYAVGPMNRGGHSQREDPDRVWAKDGTRARRNSDWFFESWQGLYDEGDGPLALIVNPAAYKDAHFATFPPKLVEPMVKAGTSEKGCCPKCGKAWERVVGKERKATRPGKETKVNGTTSLEHGNRDPQRHVTDSRTLGWRPACGHYEAEWARQIEERFPRLTRARGRKRQHQDAAGRWSGRAVGYILRGPLPYGDSQPCTVLDPFSGAGTTAMVAAQLGRRAIGIDLSEKYNRMAATRIGKALNPATFVDEDAEADLPLLATTGQREDGGDS